MRKYFALATGLVLAGCAVTPVPTTTTTPTVSTRGLERVMGASASQLTALFGEPAQDFREEGARKLQFTGTPCVLDTYLYPQGSGSEYVVTHVDARNAAGQDVDRAQCVEALAR